MQDFTKNLIQHDVPVLEAMKKIDAAPLTQTLFVVDQANKLLGTVTDGDIRRGLINGYSLSDSVDNFMLTNFTKINHDFSVYDFKTAKNKGIKLLPVLDENDRIIKVFDLRRHKSKLPLECMIMAGGLGQRLRPLTENTPKPMLPLGNKPIIEHNIDQLISYGIEKIYISVKYLGQQIVDYFGDGSGKGISIEYIWEDEFLGTAGALSLVGKFESDHVLLMNSDLFTSIDFEDLYLNVINQNASIGVATVPYTTKVPYGIFTTNDNHEITGLKEKPVYTNYANAGIYILKTDAINEIPQNTFFHITHLMEKLMEKGEKVIHNPIVGYWIDIGQHQDYKNAQEIVKHIANGN
ncbi:nucleotidyltransferase family protein [Draconibacterium orientale]|uniref:nucleotidyltransferase family protein n=1 Tax=Draconibacterium orientale TaxID=1168034 RepID=UPI002A0A4146|nr:nucleotidyltransferase family protein [Draconibacterium orientale]